MSIPFMGHEASAVAKAIAASRCTTYTDVLWDGVIVGSRVTGTQYDAPVGVDALAIVAELCPKPLSPNASQLASLLDKHRPYRPYRRSRGGNRGR